MSKAFKDYYEHFKGEAEGIDPSLSREDNYQRFKRASSRYSQMHGKDVELSMVKAALGIFGDETKYQEYRQNYIRYKLEGFIDGAIENNTLLRSKYNGLLKNAAKNGISEAEVKGLLELLNIKIKNNPRTTTNKNIKEEKVREDTDTQESQGKTTDQDQDQGKTKDQGRTRVPTPKKSKKISKAGIFGLIVIISLAGLGLYKYTPLFNRQSQPAASDRVSKDTNTIDLAQAISFLALQPPEYSKIEEAVKALRANISQPGAKEGLIKAADIYLKWGDDTPNIKESRSMYQKALECSSAANGSRTDEIKSKLEAISQ